MIGRQAKFPLTMTIANECQISSNDRVRARLFSRPLTARAHLGQSHFHSTRRAPHILRIPLHSPSVTR